MIYMISEDHAHRSHCHSEIVHYVCYLLREFMNIPFFSYSIRKSHRLPYLQSIPKCKESTLANLEIMASVG